MAPNRDRPGQDTEQIVMVLSPRFTEAFLFAADLHRGQVRKGTGVPYLSHLMAVAGLALENGADEDEAIASLLHDAVEDGGGDAARREIRRRFGQRVAAIVDECTDAEVIPKPPWRPRKEAYIAHMRHASPSARLVSAADKLHNARTILADYRVAGEALWDRFNASRDEILWYYEALVAALKEGGPMPLVEELQRVVDELIRVVRGGGR